VFPIPKSLQSIGYSLQKVHQYALGQQKKFGLLTCVPTYLFFTVGTIDLQGTKDMSSHFNLELACRILLT